MASIQTLCEQAKRLLEKKKNNHEEDLTNDELIELNEILGMITEKINSNTMLDDAVKAKEAEDQFLKFMGYGAYREIYPEATTAQYYQALRLSMIDNIRSTNQLYTFVSNQSQAASPETVHVMETDWRFIHGSIKP